MKKGWKRFWIICGSIFGAGVLLCLIAAGLGFTWEGLRAAYPNGIGWTGSNHFSNVDWDDDWEDDWEEAWEGTYNESSNSRGTESGSFTREYPWTPNLDLEMRGGDLTLKSYKGDKIKLETQEINPELEFRCFIDEDKLCIRTSKKVWKENGLKGKKAGEATLYIPEGRLMEEIQLKAGAGKLTADELLSSSVEVEIGAGEAVLSGIQAYELDMESGAGNITAACVAMGDIDVKCGVGSLDLTIEGSENSYNESVTCGIGKIRIGTREYSGLGRTMREERGGTWDLEAKCGIGNISIDFK